MNILELSHIDLNHLKLKKVSRDIIQILYKEKEFIFEAPKMLIPFDFTDTSLFFLSFDTLNKDQTIFFKFINDLTSLFSQKMDTSLSFIHSLKKNKDYNPILKINIMNYDSILVFNESKKNISMKDIHKGDYCKSILYISNIWINHKSHTWGYNICLLQLKLYSLYRILTEYSFKEDKIEQEKKPLQTVMIKDDSKIEIQHHANYKKYFKMLNVGVPKEHIKVQMSRDGIDNTYIDYEPNYLISKETILVSNNLMSLIEHKKPLQKVKTTVKEKIVKKSLFSLEDILKKLNTLKKVNTILF